MKVLIALLMASSLYGGAILSIAPTPAETPAGRVLQLDVTVSGAPNLIGFQFDVLFPSFLRLDSVVEAGYFGANGVSWWAGTDEVGARTGISDVLVAPGPLPEPDTLVTLRFTALAPGSGAVSLGNILLLDSDFSEAPVDALNAAQVSVTATPEPGTWLFVAAGLGLAAAARLRRRSALRS